MKQKLLFFISIIMIIALLAVPAAGFADIGNFVGDSDWGGSGFDFGGWDSDYDSDWDGGYSGGNMIFFGGLGNSGGDDDGSFLLGLIVVIAVVVFVVMSKRKKKKSGGNASAYRSAPVDFASIQRLLQEDPNFSELDFLQDASNTFVRLQNAWQAKDLAPVRNVLTDNLYAQFERQMQPYIANGQTNHVENIAVLRSALMGWRQDEVNDILTVELHVRLVDYVTDDKTGTVIRGSKTKERFMGYEYTFIRTKGGATAKPENGAATCPHCGAPMDINHSGRCAYCDSVLSSGEYDWVVSGIRGLYQRS